GRLRVAAAHASGYRAASNPCSRPSRWYGSSPRCDPGFASVKSTSKSTALTVIARTRIAGLRLPARTGPPDLSAVVEDRLSLEPLCTLHFTEEHRVGAARRRLADGALDVRDSVSQQRDAEQPRVELDAVELVVTVGGERPREVTLPDAEDI